MADTLLERISALDPKRRELLVRMLANRQGAPGTPPLRPYQGDRTAFPLSFAQQRLWLVDQLEPGSSRYNVLECMRLRGPLVREALRASLQDVVARHEVLRTFFRLERAEPQQCIARSLEVTMGFDDLADLAPETRLDEARRRAVAEGIRPFSLDRLPLFRAHLFRLSQTDHLFLVAFHHIIYDGWSRDVLVRELVASYEARQRGEALAQPALDIQYADFTLWQREYMQGAVLESHLEYWRQALRGAPTVLDLPTDRPRSARMSDAGGQHVVTVPSSVRLAFESLCQREHATLFMGMLALFGALLHRFSRQEDMIIGAAVANRTRPELERMIGFFVNTLPLRLSVAGDPSFLELLRQARQVTIDANTHQDLPFERLVEELRPERELGRNPLFQVVMSFMSDAVHEIRMHDLVGEPLALDRGVTIFDLNLFIREHEGPGGGLSLIMVYSSHLFAHQTIVRLTSYLGHLMQEVAASPDRRVSQYPMIAADERAALVAPHREPLVVDPRCLHEVFEAHVAACPDAVAVVCETSALSYAELDRRANRLAHCLRARGVDRGTLVGLCVERSLDMPVAILGTLKAGAAYVPLDPRYPADRLQLIIADARVAVLVTTRELRDHLPTYTGPVVLLGEALTEQPDTNPVSNVDAGDIAYVIYTSGSTGKPKGVLVTHANVQGLFAGAQPIYGFGPDDAWTVFHSYAFDFAVWEFWGAWLYGGRAVIVPYLVARSPDAFHDLVVRERVTVLNQTPGEFRQFMRVHEERPDGAPSLRLVYIAGEPCDFRMLRPWFERHGDKHPLLVNAYGITETTILVSHRPITAMDMDAPPGGFIGHPFPGFEMYILDEHREPTPIGMAGELYVGGVGIARGYLNRPELTQARFIPHLFSGEPGALLYRSGDLVRRRVDGELEFLGRIDHQVKLRGHRIELGEIETVLIAHPAVSDACVLVHDYGVDDQRLVAFVVLAPGQAEGSVAAELRQQVQKQLPAIMVPALFLPVPALPLNQSGKVDRAALLRHVESIKLQAREEERSSPDGRAAGTPPRTPDEERLVRIWSELLQVPNLGIDDNFFALGGHSLLGIQLMHRIREAWGRTLRLGSLFEAPTVAQMAHLLSDASHAGRGNVVVPIRSHGSQPPLFLIHPSGGEVMAYHGLAEAIEPACVVYGIQSRALATAEPEHESMDAMCQAYAAAIREVQPHGPYRIAGWSMGGLLAMGVTALLEARGHTVAWLGLIDSYVIAGTPADEPFDDLVMVLGGRLASAFLSLPEDEQARLRAELGELPLEERVERAIVWAQRRALIDQGLMPEMLVKQARLSALHRRIMQDYRPPVVHAPLSLWWAGELLAGRPRTEWRSSTRAGIRSESEIAGNHYSMMQAPHVQTLGKELGASLAAADIAVPVPDRPA